jgi:D-sedoheptulose 7-phosphate isomerase
MNPIHQILLDSIEVKKELLNEIDTIQSITDRLIQAIQRGNKLLICGNGGSAADAQHVAAELVGKFFHDRAAIPAIAMTTNTSSLTALGNDYSYDIIFARQVEAFAKPGDIFAGISTSGNSENVIQAARTARQLGCFTIGFTGQTGGKLIHDVDICLCAPSISTPRIQEAHILVWHIICELLEAAVVHQTASSPVAVR